MTTTALRLNLGACDRNIPGFVSVDIAGPADQIVDLAQFPWPWGDSTVEEVVAFDVIEHIPNRIAFMNELHRILVPGGKAHIITPNAAKGAGYYQDPTHCSPWCLNSFQYFEHDSFAQKRLGRNYGITASFRIEHLSEAPYMDVREEVWKITAILEAVK